MNPGRAVSLVTLSLALWVTACQREAQVRVSVIDLLKQIGSAEKRPVHGSFDLVDHGCGGNRSVSVAVPASSRLTWSTKFPDGAVFVSSAAVDGPPGASALFRVGISDDRIYEQLEARTVTADECGTAWVPIEVDLRQYSGWKLSLFYQPRQRTWRLVLGTNEGDVAPVRAYWAAPRIEAGAVAARRFLLGK